MKFDTPFADLESQPATTHSVALPSRVSSRNPPSYDWESDASSQCSTEKQSKHYRSPSAASLAPYVSNSDPTDSEDDQTVAELAFKHGFFFPVLWIFGAYIMASPLQVPPAASPLAWLPDKTEEEKQMHLYRERREELVWARRSLIALITLIVAIIITIGVVVAVQQTRP
ncbi:hypothetical protein BDV98DRAFT_657930 [Pterulicium gracile]|uniref:Transmembrane protein n=1 Tax=Pterulicium gracile TaxID=1884261 RepID=A0A5C3Q8V7_9AGAR|nr:hypothetical protein BDV98DRAFT_657930 [Pterula gracilis]